jgi:hypothetical protein
MSTCNFVITRGANKGNPCGKKVKEGGLRCSKHLNSGAVKAPKKVVEKKRKFQCPYVFGKGKNKGQQCPKKCLSLEGCYRHKDLIAKQPRTKDVVDPVEALAEQVEEMNLEESDPVEALTSKMSKLNVDKVDKVDKKVFKSAEIIEDSDEEAEEECIVGPSQPDSEEEIEKVSRKPKSGVSLFNAPKKPESPQSPPRPTKGPTRKPTRKVESCPKLEAAVAKLEASKKEKPQIRRLTAEEQQTVETRKKNIRKIKKTIVPNSQYAIDEVKQQAVDKLEESLVEEYGVEMNDECDQDDECETNYEADEMTWGDVEVEC